MDHIVKISVRVYLEDVVDLTEERETYAKFVYSVHWKEVDIPFDKRMGEFSESFLLADDMKHHWFSIINSCAALLLLIGCLMTYYIRVLQKDFPE